MELKICHLYPDVLNLYGDRGNIICLQKRLEWRGIDCRVDYVKLGEHKGLTEYDLFFIGGGQDFDQEILLEDLRIKKGPEIRAALEDGRTFLCICGGVSGRHRFLHSRRKKEDDRKLCLPAGRPLRPKHCRRL